jgi:hypothetical protein
MAFWDFLRDKTEKVDESIDVFRGKGDEISQEEKADQKGEGWEQLSMIPGVGNLAVGSFNMFYNQYVNRVHENEIAKIMTYREMAMYPEIADVIEDGTNESTQVDHDDRVINLQILDAGLTSNENIVKNITKEFNSFFYQQLEDFPESLWDFFRTYLIDGRLFYERVINEKKQAEGIKSIKKLPSETMDYIYDPATGTILTYFQYLKRGGGRPKTLEDAKKRKDVVVFNPEQIGFINYGIFGKNKYDILGYLEKCKVPYNQLKLLEISVVIYRLIRAPERFVFRIDTGNMPRDKALKYVEKIKLKMAKKQTYDSTTGQLTMEPEVFSMLENFYLPQSADGRGSQIDSLGGNVGGFAELDDLYYFARKLYRALKYPPSRVEASNQGQSGDVMFGGNSTGEIPRDEIKWAKFLERQQNKFELEMTRLFLIHLEFKGLKREYDLSTKKIRCVLVPPSNYKEQMEQNFLESRYNNYQALADRPEISKYYLMKKFLRWSEDDIQENINGLKKDAKYGFIEDEADAAGGGFSDRRLKENIEII